SVGPLALDSLAGGIALSSPSLARRTVQITNANNAIKPTKATVAYLSRTTLSSSLTATPTASSTASSAVSCLRLTTSNVSSTSNTSNATGPILSRVPFFMAPRSFGRPAGCPWFSGKMRPAPRPRKPECRRGHVQRLHGDHYSTAPARSQAVVHAFALTAPVRHTAVDGTEARNVRRRRGDG